MMFRVPVLFGVTGLLSRLRFGASQVSGLVSPDEVAGSGVVVGDERGRKEVKRQLGLSGFSSLGTAVLITSRPTTRAGGVDG